jgi:hypothetical protein
VGARRRAPVLGPYSQPGSRPYRRASRVVGARQRAVIASHFSRRKRRCTIGSGPGSWRG